MGIYSDDDSAFKAKVKYLFDGEGIKHITTLTHANVVERFIRTIQHGINERIQFNKGNWTDMLKHVLNKYLNTVHSSTDHTPKEGHQDTNTADVSSNLELKRLIKESTQPYLLMIMLRFIPKVMVNIPHEKNITQDGVKQNIR